MPEEGLSLSGHVEVEPRTLGASRERQQTTENYVVVPALPAQSPQTTVEASSRTGLQEQARANRTSQEEALVVVADRPHA
jgi:hypothetical protein